MLVLLLAAELAPAGARADGDPASDVLATESIFLPQDAALPAARQAQLATLVMQARGRGYPIRVAVIASRSDLGSVTELWRSPASYARFLGQELALVYRGRLLVVMPNGYGFAVAGAPGPPAARGALAGLPPPRRDLGGATIAAVRRLSAAAGHPLTVPAASGSPSSRAGSADVVSWLVFLGGLILVVAAWAASLRARPPHVGARTDVAKR